MTGGDKTIDQLIIGQIVRRFAKSEWVRDPLKALDARRQDKADGPILRNALGAPWSSDSLRAS
jgi:hypothetical protein